MNQDLVELETQIKAEKKIGKEVSFVKRQLADNQVRSSPAQVLAFEILI